VPRERDTLEVDVLFVGAGPASLGGAIRLAQLYAQHNEAVKAGAAGYLLKNAGRDDISHTIREVSQGGLLINTTMLNHALAGAAHRSGD